MGKERTRKQRSHYRKKRKGFSVSKTKTDRLSTNSSLTITPPSKSQHPPQAANDDFINPSTPVKSSSAKKLKLIELGSPAKDEKLTGYRLIDLEILSDIFQQLLCPFCKDGYLKLIEKCNLIKGLASYLELYCMKCDNSINFNTSRPDRNMTSSPGQNIFDVNHV